MNKNKKNNITLTEQVAQAMKRRVYLQNKKTDYSNLEIRVALAWRPKNKTTFLA
jgi:uncharacterized protein YnzC (UPF0291/DUF896 family)